MIPRRVIRTILFFAFMFGVMDVAQVSLLTYIAFKG